MPTPARYPKRPKRVAAHHAVPRHAAALRLRTQSAGDAGSTATAGPPKRAATTRQRGQRRALSNQEGAIARHGDPVAAHQLEAALVAGMGDADRFTHGFHSYPARMHPAIARAVIASFSTANNRVLDPFCGSGTVLIEAMLAGRTAVGTDLSPLALRIAAIHCELREDADRQAFARTLEYVTSASLERVRTRTKARAPLSARERALYDPHVLIELAGLLQEIRTVQPLRDRRALEVVFSALLIKFSHQRADTSPDIVQKRIRKGLCSEFFLRKGRELVERWAELRSAVAPSTIAPVLHPGDARELPTLLGPQRFDLVLSSPPYGGTYDYHTQHALRCTWLSLDASALERAELGARRRLSQTEGAAARWDRELDSCLRAIAAVCEPAAQVVLLIGDAQVGGARVDANAQITRLAKRSGLRFIAAASQSRIDYQRGPERQEHLILLRRDAAARDSAARH